MQTYMVYKFDSKSIILKDSRKYLVVAKGSDKSMFWNTRHNMWYESVSAPMTLTG